MPNVPDGALKEFNVYFLLQGGGARAAYQLGVYEAARSVGKEPDWVVGISMGALNAAIIAGNPPAGRKAALEGFWKSIATPFDWTNLTRGPMGVYWKYVAAYTEQYIGMFGHRNFYRLRAVPSTVAPPGSDAAVSYYTDAPLARNLKRWVDFAYLNDPARKDATALSLGATNVETGLLEFFHSDDEPLGINHLRATAAMPPGSAAVEVGSKWYWDGGVAGNEPLASLLGRPPNGKPTLLVIVDLWSAQGHRPLTVNQAQWRQYQVSYQSKVTALVNAIEADPGLLAGLPRGETSSATSTLGPLVVTQLMYSESVAPEPFDAVDFSSNSIAQRIETGAHDMTAAIDVVTEEWRKGRFANGEIRSFQFDGGKQTTLTKSRPDRGPRRR